MSKAPRTPGTVAAIVAGVIIGAVESVLAIAFAAFVFGGLLATRLPDGIGLYLVAAVLTLGILAWRGGSRGVVGSVQDAAAAVLGIIAGVVAAKVTQIQQVAQATGLKDYEKPDIFLTVIAATLIVTVLCGVVFFVVGKYRLGNLVRFVPYPVVGGFLAGTGWLLLKGGIYVASNIQPTVHTAHNLIREYSLLRWTPAFVFGLILLVAVRVVKRPLVIPTVLAIGLVVFVLGMVLTGSSLSDATAGSWLLGPFESARLWEPWTFRAIGGADWSSVLSQWTAIVSAVLVACLAILFNISGAEIVLGHDLDTNRELRDAGVLNVVSGALGGIPGYHALSLTALADRMKVNAKIAGLVAALVPFAAVIFGASVIELIPRMLVGGVLVFLGLAFIVEWVWDMRKVLPRVEYLIVLAILATVIGKDFLTGIVLGLVLAAVLFAINYGRVEHLREMEFGETFRSNVDRPPDHREALHAMRDRVQLLRLDGFVFFGSLFGLLERVRTRLRSGPLRFLVLDMGRVSGVDASAVAAFSKLSHAAASGAFDFVIAGASEPVREHLARGGVVALDGVMTFEPDLDRALQRCEDLLLAEAATGTSGDGDPGTAAAGMPAGLDAYLEREEITAGTVLIGQGERPDDVFVLSAGRLAVETTTADGTRMRLRSIRPGVVVGEVAMYRGLPRTADVVAETPAVVLRLTAETLERIERERPALAAEVHRWLAATLAERLADTIKVMDALVD
jgi:SulP family sulfate permease